MSNKHDDFKHLVALAMQDPSLALMRPVVQKELLHYDILYCLDQQGLLNDLVFQGGTALRLCYNSKRYSEDLDFAGGVDFNSSMMSDIKSCIEHYVGNRYGLEATVKEPRLFSPQHPNTGINVSTWQLSLTTDAAHRDVPKQIIKLEVANIPVHTKEVRPLNINYEFLPSGYENTLLYVESLEEILADKVVAFVASRVIRYRDIWDITWLLQRNNVSLNMNFINTKISEYNIQNYSQLLSNRLQEIPSLVTSSVLRNELKRFLPTTVFDQTLGLGPKYETFLTRQLVDTFSEVDNQLQSPTLEAGNNSPSFT